MKSVVFWSYARPASLTEYVMEQQERGVEITIDQAQM
jgi:hypothetical protein